MTKKGNLCASNLPCPTWISPVEKLRCRILLDILGACESTAEVGPTCPKCERTSSLTAGCLWPKGMGVQPLDFQFKKFRKDSASVRSVKTTRLLRRRQRQLIFRSEWDAEVQILPCAPRVPACANWNGSLS